MLIQNDVSEETTRLQLMQSLRVLDTPQEERFERVTRLARRLFGTPIARVSLLAPEHRSDCRSSLPRERPSSVGSGPEIIPADAIAHEDVFVVHDTTLDPRFSDNPLVTGQPGIRFYAGYPITAPGGARVGTFFTVDMMPRLFSVEEIEMLCELGEMVESELENMTLAVTDELTRLPNRRGFRRSAERLLRLCANHGRPAAMLSFDLDGLKAINDAEGHQEGDRAIRGFARLLLKSFRHTDIVARLGGDEFCVFAADIGAEELTAPLARLSERVCKHNAENGSRHRLAYSVGQVILDTSRHADIDGMLQDADERMYAEKRRKKSAPSR